MSFLKRHDPTLFARFERARKHDKQLADVFDDLETVAVELKRESGRSAGHVAGIVAELTEELRQRVAVCEQTQKESKEKK